MTWWEVEQLAIYISSLEEAMNTWKLSGGQMRNELIKLTQLAEKVDKKLPRIHDSEKKQLLIQLKSQITQFQEQLQERLKRPLSDRISTRN